MSIMHYATQHEKIDTLCESSARYQNAIMSDIARQDKICVLLVSCLLNLQQPYKFKAHMEFGEVRKATPEEIEKNQEQVAAKEALDEAEAAERNAARAKEAAAKEAEQSQA